MEKDIALYVSARAKTQWYFSFSGMKFWRFYQWSSIKFLKLLAEINKEKNVNGKLTHPVTASTWQPIVYFAGYFFPHTMHLIPFHLI